MGAVIAHDVRRLTGINALSVRKLMVKFGAMRYCREVFIGISKRSLESEEEDLIDISKESESKEMKERNLYFEFLTLPLSTGANFFLFRSLFSSVVFRCCSICGKLSSSLSLLNCVKSPHSTHMHRTISLCEYVILLDIAFRS